MALSPFITLAAEDKLNVLRRLDQFRQWRSLDDKRYCLVCGKIITGQQIQVQGGTTRGDGALWLNCPSDGCDSIPVDWVLPPDEILTKAEMLAAEEIEAATSRLANHDRTRQRPHKTPHAIASQLRKFASYFQTHNS